MSERTVLVIGAIVVTIVALGLIVYLRYRLWLARQYRRVSADSTIVTTRLGPVEYELRGAGPVILHLHGGNVGHTGAFMFDHLVAAGYTVLTPDRPGYLGTPLGANGAPEAQADLMAALLDVLQIEQVALAAVSAGGPAALHFALRHPDRVSALVLLSAITRRTELSDDVFSSALGRLVMSERIQDFAWFLINRAMKRMPALALQDYRRTETTYDKTVGAAYIKTIVKDPEQLRAVHALADAAVPARPRFAGVMNDVHVQRYLDPIPFEQLQTPTLIVHSRFDGDVPFAGAQASAEAIGGAELIAVEQFGHMIWWGDAAVTQAFQSRIETFLQRYANGVARQ